MRCVAVKAGWDGLAVSCAGADRRSDMVDPLQSERGSKVWPRNQSKSILKGRISRRTSTPVSKTVAGGKAI